MSKVELQNITKIYNKTIKQKDLNFKKIKYQYILKMPDFYRSNVQSYSSYYSQDADGKVNSATQKYVVDDNNGKRRGKIYRGMRKPNKQDSYTRNLHQNEMDGLFGYSNKQANPSLPFIEEVDQRLSRSGGGSRRGRQLVNYNHPTVRERDPFYQMNNFVNSHFREMGNPFKDDPFFRDF